MEEQLSIVREETEKKRTFEEVSKIIRQVISKIKKYADGEYFHFSPLSRTRDDILAYMHDNQLETLKIHIKPQSLKVFSMNDKNAHIKTADVKTVEVFIEKIKGACVGGSFDFDCDPNILQISFVELGDALDAIEDLYHAYGMLESYRHIIDPFNNTILDELKRNIDAIPKAIFKSMMSEHEFSFGSSDKSEEIFRKLRNEITGLDSVQRLLWKLSLGICDQKLSAIQKEMFLRSS